MKKKESKKEFRGKGGNKKKKVFCWLQTGQVSSAGLPVCGMGGGGWKDWFHFSPFLGHTLCCCSACSPVPQGPSAPQ